VAENEEKIPLWKLKKIPVNIPDGTGGYWHYTKSGKEWIPYDKVEAVKNLKANRDFDGIIKLVQKSEFDHDQLEPLLNKMKQTFEVLGSYQKMSLSGKSAILALARKEVNYFNEYFSHIVQGEALKLYKNDYENLVKALNKYTPLKVKEGVPDFKQYYSALVEPKLADFKNQTGKAVFMLTQRVTIFDLYGKKDAQNQMLQKIVENTMGGMTVGDNMDAVMKMLNDKFPAGYIKMPAVRFTKEGFEVKYEKRIALDYYVKTWIQDIESSINQQTMIAGYNRVGIDLVQIKSDYPEEMNCPVCGPDIGRVFSLSGNDPHFPQLNISFPRHPRCGCYTIPLLVSFGSNPS